MKKMIKSSVLVFSLFASATVVSAQVVGEDTTNTNYFSAKEFNSEAGGVPFTDVRYLEAVGSAYHDLEWEMGTITTKAGKVYKDVPVRIDLMANKVHYKTEEGQEHIISVPVKEVKYMSNGKEVHFVNGEVLPNTKFGWYQVLVNGPVSLVKNYKKSFEEQVSFGNTVMNIKTNEFYLAFNGKTEVPVKKTSDLVNLFPAKKAEIEAEIKRLKSATKDDQYVGVVNFVNELMKKG
jgi:hypothetical protein